MSSEQVDDQIESLITDQGVEVDPRRHQRSEMELAVEFLPEDQVERRGALVDISAGGAFVKTDYIPAVDDVLAVKIDRIGFMQATVVRANEDGFAVKFEHRRDRAARLADKLTWMVNGGCSLAERRAAERFLQHRGAVMGWDENDNVPCQVVDISTTGALIDMENRPPVGTRVQIGRQCAIVIRHTKGGVGLEFATPPGTDQL